MCRAALEVPRNSKMLLALGCVPTNSTVLLSFANTYKGPLGMHTVKRVYVDYVLDRATARTSHM